MDRIRCDNCKAESYYCGTTVIFCTTCWEALQAENQKLKDAFMRLKIGFELIDDENQKLRERLNDWEDTVKAVMSEECDSDEKHCTCVPILREQIKKLRGQKGVNYE